ncbi:hypothetical protein [Campylobacter troglodytis]|nr:hypothetical protein [Campylobacter troglodytis]
MQISLNISEVLKYCLRCYTGNFARRLDLEAKRRWALSNLRAEFV